MNHIIISYLINKVSGVAEVKSSDVHTSLRSGSVVFNNLAVRESTLASLPIAVRRVVIGEVEIKVPNPASPAPLLITVRDVNVTLCHDLRQPEKPPTLSQIRKGINLNSILGAAIAAPALPAISNNSTAVADVEQAEPATGERKVTRQEPSASPAASADRADDEGDELFSDTYSDAYSDADLESCVSAESFDSSAASGSDTDDSVSADPEDDNEGWFAYFKRQATKSVEWIWQRPIVVDINGVMLLFPADERAQLSAQATVSQFSVEVQPTQSAPGRAERMKIVQLSFKDAHVSVTKHNVVAHLLSIAMISVKLTTVYDARRGDVIRKNTAVYVGDASLTFTERSVRIAGECRLANQRLLNLPTSCQPYISLRSRRSLWPYALCCVLQGVKDEKKKYNVNLSHLRFFSAARQRYMNLLDACHRSKSVEERADELAEAEQDLIYPDVIYFLRQRAYERHHPVVNTNDAAHLQYLPAYGTVQQLTEPTTPAPLPAPSSVAAVSPVLTSTHIEFNAVELCFPHDMILRAETIMVVLRDPDEVSVAIADVVTNFKGERNNLKTGNSEQWFSFSRKQLATGDGIASRVEIADTVARAKLSPILDSLAPIIEVAHALQAAAPPPPPLSPAAASAQDAAAAAAASAAAGAAAAASSPSAPTTATTQTGAKLSRERIFVVVPLVDVFFDILRFRTRRLSVMASVAGTEIKCGCSLEEFSVVHNHDGEDSDIVAPITVHMLPNDNIVMTPLRVRVTMPLWEYLLRYRELVNHIRDLTTQPDTNASATAAPVPGSPGTGILPLTASDGRGFAQRLLNLPATYDAQSGASEKGGASNRISLAARLEGLSVEFEPLALSVGVSGVHCTLYANSGLPTTSSHVSQLTQLQSRVTVGAVSLRLSRRDEHCGAGTTSPPASGNDDLFLTFALPDGLTIDQVSSALGAATVVSLPSMLCTYCCPPAVRPLDVPPGTDSLPSASSFSLLETGAVRVVVVGDVTVVSMDSVGVLGAVDISPCSLLIKSEAASDPPTTARPYRASCIQLSCAIPSVSLPSLLRHRFDQLLLVGTPFLIFLVDELVPTAAYQNFFSGFSDILVSLSANPIAVTWSDHDASGPGPLLVTIRGAPLTQPPSSRVAKPPSPPLPNKSQVGGSAADTSETPYTVFVPLLPSVEADGCALCMLARCPQLAIDLLVPDIRIGVQLRTPPEATFTTPETVCDVAGITVRGARLQLPIGKTDFWCEAIQRQPPANLCAEVDAVAVWLGQQQPQQLPDAEGSAGVQARRRSRAVTMRCAGLSYLSSVAPIATASNERGEAPADDANVSPPESDRTSRAASVSAPTVTSVGDTEHADGDGGVTPTTTEVMEFSVEEWNLVANAACGPESLGSAWLLLDTISSIVVPAVSSATRTVLDVSLRRRLIDLDAASTFLFLAPFQVLLVEECVFTSSAAGEAAAGRDNLLVVGEATTVVFRRCTFRTPRGDRIISCAALSSCFHLEDCFVSVLSPETKPPASQSNDGNGTTSSATATNTPAVSKKRFILCLQRGVASVTLVPHTTLRLVHAVVASTVHSESGRVSFHVRCNDVRGDYAVAGGKRLSVCDRIACEAECSARKHRSLALNCTLTISDVHVPLLHNVIAHTHSTVRQYRTPIRNTDGMNVAETTKRAAHTESKARQLEGTVCLAPPTVAKPSALSVAPSTTHASVGVSAPAASGGSSSATLSSHTFPFTRWKVLISTSVVPVEFVFPSGLPLAKIVLSNSFLASNKKKYTPASVEGRIAVHYLALLEVLGQAPTPVLLEPLYVNMQGKVSPEQGILRANCTCSLSAVRAAVSTPQIRCLRLAQQLPLSCFSESSDSGPTAATTSENSAASFATLQPTVPHLQVAPPTSLFVVRNRTSHRCVVGTSSTAVVVDAAPLRRDGLALEATASAQRCFLVSPQPLMSIGGCPVQRYVRIDSLDHCPTTSVPAPCIMAEPTVSALYPAAGGAAGLYSCTNYVVYANGSSTEENGTVGRRNDASDVGSARQAPFALAVIVSVTANCDFTVEVAISSLGQFRNDTHFATALRREAALGDMSTGEDGWRGTMTDSVCLPWGHLSLNPRAVLPQSLGNDGDTPSDVCSSVTRRVMRELGACALTLCRVEGAPQLGVDSPDDPLVESTPTQLVSLDELGSVENTSLKESLDFVGADSSDDDVSVTVVDADAATEALPGAVFAGTRRVRRVLRFVSLSNGKAVFVAVTITCTVMLLEGVGDGAGFLANRTALPLVTVTLSPAVPTVLNRSMTAAVSLATESRDAAGVPPVALSAGRCHTFYTENPKSSLFRISTTATVAGATHTFVANALDMSEFSADANATRVIQLLPSGSCDPVTRTLEFTIRSFACPGLGPFRRSRDVIEVSTPQLACLHLANDLGAHVQLVSDRAVKDATASPRSCSAVLQVQRTSGECSSAHRYLVQLNEPIRLECKQGEATVTSSPLTLSDAAGHVVECVQKPPRGFSSTFLLTVQHPAAEAPATVTVKPAVVLVNRDRAGDVKFRHRVHSSDDKQTLVLQNVKRIKCLESRSYVYASQPGYKDVFALCWGFENQYCRDIEVDLTSNTNWSTVVRGEAGFLRLTVSKVSSWEPCFVVADRCCTPFLRIVNATQNSVGGCAPYTSQGVDTGHCVVDDASVPLGALLRAQGSAADCAVPAKHGAVVSVPALGCVVTTMVEGRMVSLVLTNSPPALVPVLAPPTIPAASGHDNASDAVLGGTPMEISATVTLSGIEMFLRDAHGHDVLRAAVKSVGLWVMRDTATSIQFSLDDAQLDDVAVAHDGGSASSVVKGVSVEIFVRDLTWSSRELQMTSAFVKIRPIEVVVSDIFLYNMQQCVAQCAVPPGRLSCSESVLTPCQRCNCTKEPAVIAGVPADIAAESSYQSPLLISVDTGTLSGSTVTMNWDRSVRPPENFIFGKSRISAMIPSLHNVVISIPKLRYRQLTAIRAEDLATILKQRLLSEFLQQIPQTVSSISLLSTHTLLGNVASQIGSLFWGSIRKKKDDTEWKGYGLV